MREVPDRSPADVACELARRRFWRDEHERLIGSPPDWPGAALPLDLDEALAHALVLVLSQLPAASRRPFAEAFYDARLGPPSARPRDRRTQVARAASIVLEVFDLIENPLVHDDRVLDLLQGAAQGDDLTATPAAALEHLRRVIARIRLDVDYGDPANAEGAAALALAEVLDPSSDVVDVKEVLARSAWAAVASWEPARVLAFLLAVDRL
ncbi:MAG: hypothetical protein HOQ28_17870 [Thermoleophilia bacterium]|nr:hypothetical protein [Thermoleophilia bacterium]